MVYVSQKQRARSPGLRRLKAPAGGSAGRGYCLHPLTPGKGAGVQKGAANYKEPLNSHLEEAGRSVACISVGVYGDSELQMHPIATVSNYKVRV